MSGRSPTASRDLYLRTVSLNRTPWDLIYPLSVGVIRGYFPSFGSLYSITVVSFYDPNELIRFETGSYMV